MEAETGGRRPQAKATRSHQPLQRRKAPPADLLEAEQPCCLLDSSFWSPELSFGPLSLWSFVGQPQDTDAALRLQTRVFTP